MNPRVKDVRPMQDYILRLTFDDGTVRDFDVKPYLNKGIFRALRESSVFNSVRPYLGSIQWQNGADLCPDMLYEESMPAATDPKPMQQVAEKTIPYPIRKKSGQSEKLSENSKPQP